MLIISKYCKFVSLYHAHVSTLSVVIHWDQKSPFLFRFICFRVAAQKMPVQKVTVSMVLVLCLLILPVKPKVEEGSALTVVEADDSGE